MSEESDSRGDPVANSDTGQASAALAAIKVLRDRAAEDVQSAEEANRKADSESGYALNAKTECRKACKDDHASQTDRAVFEKNREAAQRSS